MSDETITFLVLGVVVAVFVWDHLPVAAVALGTALSLWATGVLTLDQSLAGFGDPTVIFIASLFVVSEALDGDGRHLLGGSGADRPGGGEPRADRRRNAATRRAPHGADQVNGSVAASLPSSP